MPALSRRTALAVLAIAAIAVPLAAPAAFSQYAAASKEMILNDPAAPVGGNPKGDVTIVAFLDYNCPYCKKSAPDLERIVKEDGKIRLVYKDWPILRPSSMDGARLALAAKYQGKYETAHHALMSILGFGISKEQMRETVEVSGIDMKQLDADLAAHATEIEALIKRNMAQGDALGLQGTPAYLIGPFVTSTLDYQGFKQVVSNARARQAAK